MEWLSDNAWVLGVALAPAFVWVVRQLAKPFHKLADKKLPDGKLKDILIDDEVEAKLAANPDRYKTTAETADPQSRQP